MKRLVVIGAGPMGLEAALGALERGFDVTVLEKDEVGSALRRWGATTRFFSPLGMNLSERAKRILGTSLPPAETLLTGPAMVESVLAPLAASAPLAGRVRTRHKVVAVGRERMTRRDLPGHPLRAERAFRLLVETPQGERTLDADLVFDASGVYDQPAAVGVGGVPARGERALGRGLIRNLGALEQRLETLAGRRVLLVGHGHSAASAVALFEGLDPAPWITWATRSPNRRPCVEVANDPLPERQSIVSRANDLAADPPSFLTVERRASVEAIESTSGGYGVTLTGNRNGAFDAVVGLTGYRPDLSFVSELALEVSPASEGAARLHRAISNVTDCLSIPDVKRADLESGEPGFYLTGSKSYGRLPTFLLQTGRAQLETLLGSLSSTL